MLFGHCGFSKLYNTIKARLHCKRLPMHCKNYAYVCPKHCHRYKQQGREYGMLPPGHASITPWNEVCVDLIGLWTIAIQNTMCEFCALTCIDSITNLVELICIGIDNKTI